VVTAGLTGGFAYSNSSNHINEDCVLHEELNLDPTLVIYEPGFARARLAWHPGQPGYSCAGSGHPGIAGPGRVSRPRCE
jgi:hypothetical protein